MQNNNTFKVWFVDLFPLVILKNKLVATIINVFGNNLNSVYNDIIKETNYDV